jgi:uncharacterized protein YdhG (YjbR/CyaY superfamily)
MTATPPNETVEDLVPVLTKEQLSARVERLVNEDHITYLEAIIQICDETEIDPDDMAALVVGSLKDKLEAEAQRNNILPKPSSLFAD